MAGTPEILSGIRDHAVMKDLDHLEEAWVEAIGAGALEPTLIDGLVEIAQSLLISCDDSHRVATLLELLTGVISEETPARTTLGLYWLLLRQFPDNRDYHRTFCEAFEQVYPLASPERAFYEAAGLAERPDTKEALSRLLSLMRYREGSFVYHESGWGVGKILGVDPFLKQVKVDLEEKPGHRVAIDAVDSILDYLDPDSYRVLAFERKEELERLRDEDPIVLVSKVLETFGNPLPLKELKSHLIPIVLDTKGWTRWWTKTKAKLRDSGFFRIEDRAPYRVEKLESAVNYADELTRDYFNSDWRNARKIAIQAVRGARGDLKETWEKIRVHLQELVEGGDLVRQVDAASIIARTENDEDRSVLHKALSSVSVEEIVEALQALPGPEAQKRAASALREARPEDWQEITRRLVTGQSDGLRDAGLGLLEKHAPDVLPDVIEEVLLAPHKAPEAACYFLSDYVSKRERKALALVGEKSPRELLTMLLDLVDHLRHRTVRASKTVVKEFTTKIHNIFSAGDAGLFLGGIDGMDAKALRDLHQRIASQEMYSTDLKGVLLGILAEREPALLADETEEFPWEEDCIYTTAEGLERRQDEFREIMEVKLPKNFKDIGRAADFGDLSENAEYTAALETRDQLTRQATLMKEELERAKVIDKNEVSGNRVGLGSRLKVVNVETGEEKTYSVLGPWDGGPEEGVVNYNSPLARSLFGKKQGDLAYVDLPAGTVDFEIKEVGSSFD
ncbi:MAG: GreA/GreB family elongation factor [Planctomycetes bacterium]|nr:GreA/GreB family elongation factor [Planctomycetota bacterium]